MSYPINPTDPKYKNGGRYLTDYISFSTLSILLVFYFLNNKINKEII